MSLHVHVYNLCVAILIDRLGVANFAYTFDSADLICICMFVNFVLQLWFVNWVLQIQFAFFCFASFVRKFSLGGTCHVRLGEPGGERQGEPGWAAVWTQHINKKSKNPISKA